MKSNKVKINIIMTLVAILILSMASITFAFFASNKKEVSGGTLTYPTVSADKKTVEIPNEYALRVWAEDSKYNCNAETSVSSSRYMVILTGNITLTKDLIITRDVYFDLNGKTLNLQGFNLIFENTYYSSLNIFSKVAGAKIVSKNGEVDNTLGRVYYSTPNSFVKVGNKIGVADAITGIDKVEVRAYNENLFKEEVQKAIDERIYTYYDTDIELLNRFYGYKNIQIEWTSGNTALVSNTGKVTLPNLKTDVVLTYKVKNAEKIIHTGTKTITLIPKTDSASRFTIGEEFLTNYFLKYKSDTTSYILDKDITLPINFGYLGITFSYTTGDAVDISNNILIKPDGNKTITLTATIKYSTYTQNQTFTFIATKANNNSITNSIINDIGVLIVKDASTTLNLVTAKQKTDNSITKVEYSFSSPNYYAVNPATSTEKTKTDILTVTALPSKELEIYVTVKITFAFNQPTETTSRLRIYYINGLGTGDDLGAGAEYFYYLSTQNFMENTFGGKTYLSFKMPKYLLDTVAVKYELETTSTAITIASGVDYDFFNVDFANLTRQNVAVKVKFKFIMKAPGNAYDWDKIPYYGQKKETDGTTSGIPITYSFSLCGIIRNNASDISDKNFYDTIVGIYNNGDLETNNTVLTIDEISVPKDKITIKAKTISSYKGLEILNNINTLEIINSNFKDSDFQYLNNMGSLTTLSLKQNAITTANLSYLASFSSLLSLDLSGNDFSSTTTPFKLSGLVNLKTLLLQNCNLTRIDGILEVVNLETLNINNIAGINANFNNKIERLRPLIDMVKLKTIYYYGNVCTNTDFGSKGKYNTSTFVMLEKRGKEIYAESATQKFVSNPNQKEGSNVIESIVLFGGFYITDTASTINVPHKIYKTAVDTTPYTITWDILGITGETFSADTDEIQTITVASKLTAGIYKLGCDITLNSVTTSRIFEVEVKA